MSEIKETNLSCNRNSICSISNKKHNKNVDDIVENNLEKSGIHNTMQESRQITTTLLENNYEVSRFLYVGDLKLINTTLAETSEVVPNEQEQCEMGAFCFVAEERFDGSIEWFYAPLQEYDRKKLHVEASVVSAALHQALQNMRTINDEKYLEIVPYVESKTTTHDKVNDMNSNYLVDRKSENNNDEEYNNSNQLCNTETRTDLIVKTSLPNIYLRVGGTNTFYCYKLVECNNISESCKDKENVYSSCRSNKSNNGNKLESTSYSQSLSINISMESNGLTFSEQQTSYERVPLELLKMQESDVLHNVVECDEVEVQKGNENDALILTHSDICPRIVSNISSPDISNAIALATGSKCEGNDHDDNNDGWSYIFAPIKDVFSYRSDFPDDHSYETVIDDDDDDDDDDTMRDYNINGSEVTNIKRLSTSCHMRHECGSHHDKKKRNDSMSSNNSSKIDERHINTMEMCNTNDNLVMPVSGVVQNNNGICEEINSYNSDTYHEKEEVINVDDFVHYYSTLKNKCNENLRYEYDDEVCIDDVDHVKDDRNREGSNNEYISENNKPTADMKMTNVVDVLNTFGTNNRVYSSVNQRGININGTNNSISGRCSYVFVPSSLQNNSCELQTSPALQLEHLVEPKEESWSSIQFRVDNNSAVDVRVVHDKADNDEDGDGISDDNRENCGEPIWHGESLTHNHRRRLWTPRASLSLRHDMSNESSHCIKNIDKNNYA